NAPTQSTAAAGGVIQAFGEFVAGGQIVIGLTLFIILIAIQFLVITKGATRISEVAARFALDGMPGKQMAIDADLNAQLISADQARIRRQEISDQADFYGAMDGASKFVRGDAIASIVITLINIVAGLAIGMVNHGMEFSKAVEVFTVLTIGDGLVTQVPAFLISLAAGLIVTRTSTESDLPRDIISQLFRHSEAMFMAAAFLLVLSMTGLPTGPLLMLGSGLAVIGVVLQRGRQQKRQEDVQEANRAEDEQQQAQLKSQEDRPEDHLHVDLLELHLGLGLYPVVDPAKGGDLLGRVKRVRSSIAQQLGILLPKVRVCDNVRIGERSYMIRIRDVPVATGEVFPSGLLAVDTGTARGPLPGIETVEPTMGHPARWIEPSQKEQAELMGYGVFEPSAVITTHLSEVIQTHAGELLTREQVHELIVHLKERAPRLVEELVPDVVRPGLLHQVLVNLLREQVPVRHLETILETLGTYADRLQEPGILTEYVRHSLSRNICQQLRDDNQVMRVITIDPAVEEVLAGGCDYGERGLIVRLSPQIAEAVTAAVKQQVTRLDAAGFPQIVVCSNPQVRAGLRHITAVALPRLSVLNLSEITRDTEVETMGQIGPESLQELAAMAGAAR
ncbi:MAG: FHIPEP family type III secretion protein, partial [Planctomycetaceae bacterium]|nr:FHIPEP family type III secretion protein [Planctomycetaceae bacterium]